MKKMTLFVGILFLTLFSNATIYTVDKTAGAGAQFADIAPAIAAAASGDTLLVHSSQYNYGTVGINKFVVLIGPGHHPEVNQFLPASVTTFILQVGSSGTVIEGFAIGTIDCPGNSASSNVTIRNNYFGTSSFCISGPYGDNANADDWLIEGNVMVDPQSCSGCYMIDLRSAQLGNDNWTFRNNYLEFNHVGGQNHMVQNANSTTIFANNIIVHNSPGDMFGVSSFLFLENNIFWSTSTQTNVSAGCVNCGFNNNIFYNPAGTLDVIPGVDNIMNQDPQFVDLNGVSANWNYSNDYHLMSGSPAMGSAADGDDMGIYGADYNFRMFGYTNDIPRLTSVLPQYLVVPVDGTFSIDFGGSGAGQ